MLTKLINLCISLKTAFCKAFDIRDFFIFGGLVLMGYGLWLFRPWIGFAVSGAVMMALGLGWLTRSPAK